MALKNARGWLTHLGVVAARPGAFVVFVIYGAAWMFLGDGLKWHSIATLATWGMTLVIQRAEHRDTQAIHAKLDELLKAEGNADNDVMGIDDKDAEEVESERKEIRAS
jgi:low affinity Fe/Cu permease